ncbi:MAG: hypothetical protein Q8O52_12130 [Sulfuritalea sp.]|nr:hypothetical protein [Sulfuritalea sp.]
MSAASFRSLHRIAAPFRPKPLAALLMGALALAALLPLAAGTARAENGITDLGTLGGTTSSASGVSADGSVVVGGANTVGGSQRAFRWTNNVMTDLGTLGGTGSFAYDVSADGAVVVGMAYTTGGSQRAFRWTNNVMTDLGTLGGTATSRAWGVSADGSVVVGMAPITGNANRAFRWVQGATGGVAGNVQMYDLGTLGGTSSVANGVSADGAVVVGWAYPTGDAALRAFRWTNNVMTDLGTLGGTDSGAESVSADGSVVVGWAQQAGAAYRAFRWTSAGMVNLGTLGGTESFANGVSADGAVVVGQAQTVGNTAYRAFRWRSGGMQSVEDWLRANGVTVPADITDRASATNSDGSVVVGTLANNHAFIARVAAVGSGLVTLADLQASLGAATTGGGMALSAWPRRASATISARRR